MTTNTNPPASDTPKPARWRSKPAMFLAIAAAALGLAVTPALSASASSSSAGTAARSATGHMTHPQPAYVPAKGSHRPLVSGGLEVEGTAAGMPPTAQALYAVVNANGTLARGFGTAAGTENLGLGVYQVQFYEPISTCAFLGTIGLTGSAGESPAGEIAVVGRAADPDGVFVETFNSAGAPEDLSFHLGVLC
jgi:hypothetical protein